jgi:diaminopimelate epimerase
MRKNRPEIEPGGGEHSMNLVFHKMHGAGNDFVVLDLRQQEYQLTSSTASFIANRHLGVGCDQILVLKNAREPGNTARYEVWNSDGSKAGQCGNGARCIGLFLSRISETDSKKFSLESPSGVINLNRHSDGEFELEMGVPDFTPARIPLAMSPDNGAFSLDSPWGELKFGAVSMGNPHALILVDDIDDINIPKIGAFVSTHSIFPEGCNVGFAKIESPRKIQLRVYERGAGETLACGSGACAAVAILKKSGQLDAHVDVLLPGGHLVIKWLEINQPILMKGPATYLYTGTLNG